MMHCKLTAISSAMLAACLAITGCSFDPPLIARVKSEKLFGLGTNCQGLYMNMVNDDLVMIDREKKKTFLRAVSMKMIGQDISFEFGEKSSRFSWQLHPIAGTNRLEIKNVQLVSEISPAAEAFIQKETGHSVDYVKGRLQDMGGFEMCGKQGV